MDQSLKLDYRCNGNYCLQATKCRRFLSGPEAKNSPVPFAAFDMRDTVDCDGFLLRRDAGNAGNVQTPLGYEVVADDVQPSSDLGAWTCKACGFRGFWRGGPHCAPRNVPANAGNERAAD